MKLTDRYQGGDAPFQGDLTLMLRALPAGATVQHATVIVMPAATAVTAGFQEIFTFDSDQGALRSSDWGVTRTAIASPGIVFAQVDFHARRMLSSLRTKSAGLAHASLQVDVGGGLLGVADDGSFMAPSKTAWPVDLTQSSLTLPAIAVNRVQLTGLSPSASATLSIEAVTIQTYAANVGVRLAKLAPFWTQLGDLTIPATSPDFSAILAAFLAGAPSQNGYYLIPFTVHSDSIARLDVELAIEYVLEQPVLPPPLPQATLRYGFSTLPDVDVGLTTVSLPRRAIPIAGRTSADVRGTFQPTRVIQDAITEVPPEIASGAIGAVAAAPTITVSPRSMVAQPLKVSSDLLVTAIDLAMANTQPGLAGLNFAIRTDEDGKPSEEVLASAVLRVDKPLPGQSAWAGGTLPSPLHLAAGASGTRYWIVVQSLSGEASWVVEAGSAQAPPLQMSPDGGFSWRDAGVPAAPPPLAAFFRLRHAPDRFTVPVRLRIGTGTGAVDRRLDDFNPLGRIDFSFDFAATLSDYLRGPSLASPCGAGSLLANGTFEDPPHQDATRRLFGPDAQLGGMPQSSLDTVNLAHGADLSVERYITVALAPGDRAVTPAHVGMRVNCAGAIPAQSTAEEIAAAINRATGLRAVTGAAPGAPLAGSVVVTVTSTEPNSPGLTLQPWCSPQMPSAWQGTPAQVYRLVLLDQVVVALADPALVASAGLVCPPATAEAPQGAATLSQRFAARSGCAYLLRLTYFYLGDGPAPEWRISWLSGSGATLTTQRGTLPSLKQDVLGRGIEIAWRDAEISLVAPTGVETTELEIINGNSDRRPLLLRGVTVTPVQQAVRGGDFRQWQPDSNVAVPPGWTAVGGSVAPFPPAQPPVGAQLLGDGPDETVLSQIIPVVGGDSYKLLVTAWTLPAGPPGTLSLDRRARLELRWAGGGAPAALLALDESGFLTYSWAGAAPAGADSAEVRLVKPHGAGSLVVQSVSVTRDDLVPIPLALLAETTGELTVSGLRVTYDLPAPPVPEAVPAAPPVVELALMAEPPTPSPAQPVAGPPVETPPAPPAGGRLLTDVSGVKEGIARRLAAIGIDSIDKLATATPDDVARALPIPSVVRAARLIEEAKRLVETGNDGHPRSLTEGVLPMVM